MVARLLRAAVTEADMETESLAAALEREHQEIDARIEAFTAGLPPASRDRQPLARAIRALRRHIYLEEEFLFPVLGAAEPGLAAPVFVMLHEHAQLWRTLDELARELDAGPGTGPGTGPELALCRQLAVQLLHHNLKEEKVLYPRAGDLVTRRAATRLREFLSAGELPDGWVCFRARG